MMGTEIRSTPRVGGPARLHRVRAQVDNETVGRQQDVGVVIVSPTDRDGPADVGIQYWSSLAQRCGSAPALMTFHLTAARSHFLGSSSYPRPVLLS
jgi:hypothetical protein